LEILKLVILPQTSENMRYNLQFCAKSEKIIFHKRNLSYLDNFNWPAQAANAADGPFVNRESFRRYFKSGSVQVTTNAGSDNAPADPFTLVTKCKVRDEQPRAEHGKKKNLRAVFQHRQPPPPLFTSLHPPSLSLKRTLTETSSLH